LDYPFSHARGTVRISEFLDGGEPHPQRIPRAFLRGRAILERALTFHYQLLRRLVVLANRAEPQNSISCETAAPLPSSAQ
jgi:hypothetical protein